MLTKTRGKQVIKGVQAMIGPYDFNNGRKTMRMVKWWRVPTASARKVAKAFDGEVSLHETRSGHYASIHVHVPHGTEIIKKKRPKPKLETLPRCPCCGQRHR